MIKHIFCGCCLDGLFDGWDVQSHVESSEKDLQVIHLDFHSKEKRCLPEAKLKVTIPQRDIQVRWQMTYPACHHFFSDWWDGGQISSFISLNAPVYSYMNLEGENRFTVSLSEALELINTRTGPMENGTVIAEFSFGRKISCHHYSVSFRIDCRKIHFSEVLKEVSEWYEIFYPPTEIPATARLPLYSSWYQFLWEISAEKLEKELPEIVRCHLKNTILDDGWNYSGAVVPGTYSHCGDWDVAEDKFPDMKAHVQKFHDAGLKYMVWFPVPFIGCLAKTDFAKFKGKYLVTYEAVGVLDPRFPEVREYLIELYKKVVSEWNLDGLKLDFIDSFRIYKDDPAEAENFAGRDIKLLPEAVDRLLYDILNALKKINSEIMIEFRQKYVGPAMRKYGNMFRAADCPNDLLENRVRTVDLRLLAGKTAVHSDMLVWPKEETPEIAALQILNVIFSVPQVSCILTDLPMSHKKMIAFWMSFCVDHMQTLQFGIFRPEHPEQSYPVVSAFGSGETITAVYSSGMICPHDSGNIHIFLNAKHTQELIVDLKTPVEAELFNVFGEKINVIRTDNGLFRFMIPPSGFLKLKGYEHAARERNS